MTLPWPERLNMLSINPEAATREDIARMATEASSALWAERELWEIVKIIAPVDGEDAITNAMMISGIRRMMESQQDRYLALANEMAGKES